MLGWKEYEMEVVRDKDDNCIIVCSIENIDPMGVHTGDSITVAPALTLTDKEYQIMRNASIAVLREIGVETGGSNVQFAVNPADGRLVVIEMNPRVSRSSALASKATGFPIAKIAAKLAVGYTLDELANDITGGATPASFEPTIDYVVTKIPRFAFEKFPGAKPVLTTSMKSVGEAMAIGRTFPESLQKALRSMETGLTGLDDIALRGSRPGRRQERDPRGARHPLPRPAAEGRAGAPARRRSTSRSTSPARIDPWFIAPAAGHRRLEARVRAHGLPQDAAQLPRAQGDGLLRRAAGQARRARAERGRREAPGARRASRSTSASTPARRSSPRPPPICTRPTSRGFAGPPRCEARPSSAEKIIILGGGPNRIGQGIEFDYCCCHAAFALSAAGYETIMVNCNPETVSTDYDTSDRLYFEPLTAEDVLEIVRTERANGKRQGRDRAVRRPDAAQARASAGGGRRADPRHLARRHRPRRGPRPLQGADRAARASSSRKRHRPLAGGGAARSPRRSASRWSSARPMCSAAAPWRSCTTRRSSRRYIAEAVVVSGKSPVLIDSLSPRRHRGRCRRARRRQGRLHLRRHGAYRGGRRAFRRLGLLAAAALAEAARSSPTWSARPSSWLARSTWSG